MKGETMNELTKTTQTPIEIVLGVDENGMTTARKLYDFLELRKADFARWCRTNITENEFAAENEDYVRFFFNAETPTGGKIQREDFRLTAHFAKKLSVKGNGEKAEQAREYFTTVEERAKQLAIDRSQLSPHVQLMNMLCDNISRQELEQKRQSEKISKIEENQKAINAALIGEREEDFKQWVKHCLSAIAESPNYHYIGNTAERHRAVRAESYERLNNKRPCRLKQRVESEKGRVAMGGASQTRINAISKLSIIENDRDLKPVYETVIKEMMIAYCVQEL